MSYRVLLLVPMAVGYLGLRLPVVELKRKMEQIAKAVGC